jgi:flavorubredoxin
MGPVLARYRYLWLDAPMQKSLLIVYHSQSGASLQLALAARRGAQREDSVVVNWQRAWDAGLEDLQACDAVLLVAAENSATVAGGMKDFLDRTYYPAQAASLTLPCALIVSAGNDGRGAIQQVQRILSGFPLKSVAEPLVCRGEVNPAQLESCAELGHTLSAGLSLGIY